MTPRGLTVAVLIALIGRDALAQGIVGGTLIEARSTRPLACWDVELRTLSDSVLARSVTRSDGTFDFPAPAKGAHRFRFSAFGLHPLEATFESAGPATDFEGAYSASLVLQDPTGARMQRPLTPGTPRAVPGRGGPRYPDQLRSDGIEGDVFAAFRIDSAGRVDSVGAFVWGATHREFERATRRALHDMRFIIEPQPGRTPCAFVGTPFLFRLSKP